MTDYVDVEPVRELRTEFARTVVAADRHTRMAGTGTFRVQRDVFTELPEKLLVGAFIDGTPYRHVVEEPDADAAPDDALICEDCGKTAASPAGLAAHRRAKHEGN